MQAAGRILHHSPSPSKFHQQATPLVVLSPPPGPLQHNTELSIAPFISRKESKSTSSSSSSRVYVCMYVTTIIERPKNKTKTKPNLTRSRGRIDPDSRPRASASGLRRRDRARTHGPVGRASRRDCGGLSAWVPRRFRGRSSGPQCPWNGRLPAGRPATCGVCVRARAATWGVKRAAARHTVGSHGARQGRL